MGCEFSDKIRIFKKGMIKELFEELSDKSKISFLRQYGDIANIQEDDMYKIYYHCKRTIKSETAIKSN